MRNIQKNNEQASRLNRKWSVDRIAHRVMPKTLAIHIPKMIPLVVGVFVLVVLVSGDWVIQTAMAAQPMLDLKLTGPQITQVDQPLEGINVSLKNPGLDRPNARLRLIIHDGADRDLRAGDIKIDVREGASWVPLPLYPIDGGVMGAIGAEGGGHKEIHQRGGFAIEAKSNKLLQLRLTFHLPGVYTLVIAVSPDNGNTHLAQPSFITVEAL